MQKEMRPANPYCDHDAVHDVTMLFGRHTALQTLYNAIEKRQCSALVGLRHIGKSSLLKYLSMPEVQQRYGYKLQDRIFIFTDWREYLLKTREEFFTSVCSQIIAQSRSIVSLQLSSLNGEDRFKKILEDIRDAGFRPVLLMDVFDKVTRNPNFDPDFFSFLRSLAGIYDLISYVTASIKPLYDVCHSDAVASSPFFNIFQNCTIGPLTLEETRELITLPAQREGYDFTEEEIEWVIRQAGRHPFFIQMACHYLFEEKVISNNKKIDLKYVQDLTYKKELLPHFNNLWDDLTEDQKRDVKLEISQVTSSRRKFPELSESGLFRKRIREISFVSIPIIEIKDVKDALDNINNNDFLAKCKLSEMQYVIRRGNGPFIKKGTIVRDFLKAAFERMGAGGPRQDSAPEWRLYNILWYHYFKPHVSNSQAAARLEISPRQFYREQEKAIQSLLKELINLETEALKEEGA